MRKRTRPFLSRHVVACRSSCRAQVSRGSKKGTEHLEKKRGREKEKRGKEDLVSRWLEVSACVNNRVETIGRRRGGAERVREVFATRQHRPVGRRVSRGSDDDRRRSPRRVARTHSFPVPIVASVVSVLAILRPRGSSWRRSEGALDLEALWLLVDYEQEGTPGERVKTSAAATPPLTFP